MERCSHAVQGLATSKSSQLFGIRAVLILGACNSIRSVKVIKDRKKERKKEKRKKERKRERERDGKKERGRQRDNIIRRNLYVMKSDLERFEHMPFCPG